jgi:hypothetical protein
MGRRRGLRPVTVHAICIAKEVRCHQREAEMNPLRRTVADSATRTPACTFAAAPRRSLFIIVAAGAFIFC